jgi:hypothetical protein
MFRRIRSTIVRRCLTPLPLLVLAVVICGGTPAAAEDIQVVAGNLTVVSRPGPTQPGPLVLAGERGFTARLQPRAGTFLPDTCNSDPLNCLPGRTLLLDASWAGLDLPGTATLDGVTYTPLGTSSGPNQMSVRFMGSMMLPPLADSATVSAAFTFSGRFAHQPPDPLATDTLTGSGVATVTLGRLAFFPDSWFITSVLYQFESPLPAPWSTADIGPVGLPGAAGYTGGTFFVTGAGADIWDNSDAFRYVYQPLAGDATGIVARVIGEQNTHQFAKAGVMIRETLDPASATVILDVKPDGGIEFMIRSSAGGQMTFVAGGLVTMPNSWLRLVKSQNLITAFQSDGGASWTEIASVILPLAPSAGLIGLAVSSHDTGALNLAAFDHVAVSPAVITQNLLQKGGFEEYQPPALGAPGWLSDDYRETPAKSETNQPHSGNKNGACWSTEHLDCGIFQTVSAPATGVYTLTFYATADRAGGLVGANVNGALAATSNVAVRPFADYGPAYTMTFPANRGDTIEVWMYSPAVPGYVVIDDVSLTGAGSLP